MQEVEGEEFLRGLYDSLAANEAQLATTQITVTALQLHFVNHKFSDVVVGAQRSQRLAHLAKKPPLKHNELLDLQFFLEELGQLRVISGAEVLEESTIVDLTPLRALYNLHIVRCKPSVFYNFHVLAPQLKQLAIERSISSLAEVLGATHGESESPWKKLRILNASQNYISSIDDSLVGLSGLELLDLSNNLIQRVENLQFCYSLVHVNLGYNRIRSVQNTVETLGNLKVLILTGNGLESTLGLEKLLGLERLDLSFNELMQPADIEKLASLPNLHTLELKSNPMTSMNKWRTQVYQLLLKEDLVIDGVAASSSEKAAIETRRAETPLVPYAGHTTISKVGAIETPKPAFSSSASALPTETLDPNMVYNYPALKPEDRKLMAEVAVEPQPRPTRPKAPSAAPPPSSATVTTPSSSVPASSKKKPHQKKKAIAEIADPGTYATSTTESATSAPASGSLQKPRANTPTGTGELSQIMEWANEERWLLNYNAYRRRMGLDEVQSVPEGQMQQNPQFNQQDPSTNRESQKLDANPSSSSATELSSDEPRPSIGDSAGPRRKHQELRRQTLMMPSAIDPEAFNENGEEKPKPAPAATESLTPSVRLRTHAGSFSLPTPIGVPAPASEKLPQVEPSSKDHETAPTDSNHQPSTTGGGPPTIESPPDTLQDTLPAVAPTTSEEAATPRDNASFDSVSASPSSPQVSHFEKSPSFNKFAAAIESEAAGSRTAHYAAPANPKPSSLVLAEPSSPDTSSPVSTQPESTTSKEEPTSPAPTSAKVHNTATPELENAASPPKKPRPRSSKYQFKPAGESATASSSQASALNEADFTMMHTHQLLSTPSSNLEAEIAAAVSPSTSTAIGSSAPAATTTTAPQSTKNVITSATSTTAASASASDITSDEFFVSTPSHTDQSVWEDRIIIVNSKTLEEWDTQGSVVLRLEAKELVDASLENPQEVVLSYGNTNPRAFSPHTMCTYRMESDADTTKLLKLMRDILASGTKRLRCVTCQSVFTMQRMLECLKCGSTTLITIESGQSLPPESVGRARGPSAGAAGALNRSNSSLGVASSSAPPALPPHVEDAMNATEVAMNRKIYMRTMFLQDAASGVMEEMLAYFPCWLVPFNTSTQKEQRASIVISDTKLLIFIKRRPRRGSVLAFGKTGKEGVPLPSEEDYKDEELLTSISLRSLRRLVIGPFWQWFRIETTVNAEAYVMVTRSHARTFSFLQFFKTHCHWVETNNKNKEVIAHLKDTLKLALKDNRGSTVDLTADLEDLRIELYFMAYQRVKGGFNLLSSVRSTISGKDASLAPRTIILTRNNILICEEDYAKWPSLTNPGWTAPKTPHYTIVNHFSYHDIVSLAVAQSGEHPNFVAITCEYNMANGSTAQQQIAFITQGEGEKRSFISIVSKRYQEHFHIKLIPEQLS